MSRLSIFSTIGFLVRLIIVCIFVQYAKAAEKSSDSIQGETLAAVLERGYLKCGVSQGLTGFSYPDSGGNWSGIDVDMCRAVASAIFGDPNKVRFTALSAKERFTALQSGEIDILSRNTTWTFTRDTSLGLDFIGTLYYDGQGFLVPKALAINSVKDLQNAIICTNAGTTTELNLADYFQSHHLKYEVISYEKSDETIKAYESGRCDAYTADGSALAAQRLKLSKMEQHMILPEVISKEPLGPVVRQGDDQWANIVRWCLFAMINAEELGVSSNNLSEMIKSSNPNIQRLLGTQGDFGRRLGLASNWAENIVKYVGNYGEIFDKNLGKKSPLKIERGINALWTSGGIIYAPPMR